ncbi:MAG: T9SS type A sorting domain-containing protein [Bacteroidales bacterium]|nr:T9SS type A sorting domain-containing protein [Bacteroidales bacterium]
MMIRSAFKSIGFIGLCILLMSNHSFAQRQMEKLDRGVLAIKVGTTVHVSWRVLGNEYFDVSYNVYRNSTLLNETPIAGATYYVDNSGTVDSVYTVTSIVNGIEQPHSAPATVWAQNYLDIPLQRPAGDITPPYTVVNNDVLESYPDGQPYTYSPNDCSVGDVDGDGTYEIIVKWDPSNSRDNSHGGITGNVYLDAYKLDGTFLWRIDLGMNIRAGAHYTQFMVYDLDGDGKAEVACKTAPGTKDGSGNYLKTGPAETADHSAIYRTSGSWPGFVTSGPEYLTLFNGLTGAEIQTILYEPNRNPANGWGKTSETTNRVDRFLACIAYLDGIKPSLIMCRGYYGRTVLAAWDWRNGELTHRWTFDSNVGYSGYAGQGNHNLSVADVDGDGRDEIIYGSCAIDDDGSGLYTTGLGHGDALHVTDHDPERQGLEVFAPHENKKDGITFREAATGKIIWQKPNLNDVGRGLAADIIAGHAGSEFWASKGLGVYNVAGSQVTVTIPSINHAIWWDGDDLRELLDGTSITKYNGGTLLSASGCASNNGTKSNPGLQADILGDWREEVIFRNSNNAALRIYATTNPTNRRLYTLMHDPVYRMGIAWQNVAYNQPPHTGFFLGHNMAPAPPAPVTEGKLIWKEGTSWDVNGSQNWTLENTPAFFNNGDNVLFDMSGSDLDTVQLADTLKPSSVTVNSPSDYVFGGEGILSGNMRLIKAGTGRLTINTDNDFSGETSVWEGELLVNGNLLQSNVYVHRFATVGGTGEYGKGIVIPYAGNIFVSEPGVADTMKISDSLYLGGKASVYFDLSDDTSGLTKTNDILYINGKLSFLNTTTLKINLLDEELSEGTYELVRFTDGFTGNPAQIKCEILGYPYEVIVDSVSIKLKIISTREPATITWRGDKSTIWDQVTTFNWLNADTADWFVAGDTVLFNDDLQSSPIIQLAHFVPVGKMVVDATQNYSFTGSGYICGDGELIKRNTSTLTLSTPHTFTGGTNVEGGILLINNSDGSATGSGPVLVKNDARLQGTGKIDGEITIDDSATLSLENGALSTFEINNNLTFTPESHCKIELRSNANTSDTLKVSGELIINGHLELVNIGIGYYVGNKFKIFDAQSCKGTFASITPEIPGDLMKWDTTGLAETGIIKVAYYTNIPGESVQPAIFIYPNPVKSNLFINFENIENDIRISIRDMNGRIFISESKKSAEELKLNMADLNPGMYIIHITTEKHTYLYKVLKQ